MKRHLIFLVGRNLKALNISIWIVFCCWEEGKQYTDKD